MPIAKIQLPNGKIGRFEVPDGTSPEQVMQHVNQNLDSFGTQDNPTTGGFTPASREDMLAFQAATRKYNNEPNFDGSFLPPIVTDTINAGKQIYARGHDFFTGDDTSRVIDQEIIDRNVQKRAFDDTAAGYTDIYKDMPMGKYGYPEETTLNKINQVVEDVAPYVAVAPARGITVTANLAKTALGRVAQNATGLAKGAIISEATTPTEVNRNKGETLIDNKARNALVNVLTGEIIRGGAKAVIGTAKGAKNLVKGGNPLEGVGNVNNDAERELVNTLEFDPEIEKKIPDAQKNVKYAQSKNIPLGAGEALGGQVGAVSTAFSTSPRQFAQDASEEFNTSAVNALDNLPSEISPQGLDNVQAGNIIRDANKSRQDRLLKETQEQSQKFYDDAKNSIHHEKMDNGVFSQSKGRIDDRDLQKSQTYKKYVAQVQSDLPDTFAQNGGASNTVGNAILVRRYLQDEIAKIRQSPTQNNTKIAELEKVVKDLNDILKGNENIKIGDDYYQKMYAEKQRQNEYRVGNFANATDGNTGNLLSNAMNPNTKPSQFKEFMRDIPPEQRQALGATYIRNKIDSVKADNKAFSDLYTQILGSENNKQKMRFLLGDKYSDTELLLNSLKNAQGRRFVKGGSNTFDKASNEKLRTGGHLGSAFASVAMGDKEGAVKSIARATMGTQIKNYLTGKKKQAKYERDMFHLLVDPKGADRTFELIALQKRAKELRQKKKSNSRALNNATSPFRGFGFDKALQPQSDAETAKAKRDRLALELMKAGK